jgi:1-acyl-sn-glycerol-3-phosphate acyltransferase
MFRLSYVLAWFFTMTPCLIAALWVLDKLKLPGRRPITLCYYRALCRLLRVRINVVGTPSHGKPTLILSNHVSWLDILVLSTICPVAFIAKKEVSSWPIVGITARLTNTIFVDRNRRHQTAEVNTEIATKLGLGDPVVLFAEGTSSDGNRVLEFRSALVGAVAQVDPAHQVMMQPVSIGYTRIQGIPMGRQHRPIVAWYGDTDFTPHFKAFVQRGAVDVTVTFGTAVAYSNGADRKQITRTIESTVRALTASSLRARSIEFNPAA